MHSKFDLNLFVVLAAIYREGSITAAAQDLNLTQPAVSHALSRLRDMLDDPLFERHGRRMVPTGRCQQIIPDVQQSLDALHLSITTPWSGTLSSFSRTVKLGLRDVFELSLLKTLKRKLDENAPRVSIQSMHIPLEEMTESLSRGEIDIAIDAMVPARADIQQRGICTEPFVLLCRPDHPLGKRLTKTAYVTAQHVLISARRSLVNHVDMALAASGHHRHIAMICEHYIAAADVAMHSDLLLTVPDNYARQICREIPLAQHPMPVDIPALPIHMYWHNSTDNDPLLKTVRKWMEETLQHPAL
ncbi:LysR family transcriptional regulator [Salinimonas sp. HHU 13199]|uniref:LysR family transcriptional regulator n=1 Tax=Salinimonas profundi TaxID=2729140 RepID=A0ABR8LKG1_9ALTE|nr:LysR family transcriptional regulator [Salinimonas profundi]MBD3584787.1 LysR family transcriptional regulator [Salinimonas profundi]